MIGSSGRGGEARPAPHPVKSLLHAIDVLDVLDAVGRPLGVSELARRTGLSKTAVYNIATTLESRRILAQDRRTGHYQLSWRLYELGSRVAGGVDLSRVARPYLDDLAESTGETVLLAILDQDEVLYLDRADSSHVVRMAITAGRRSPLHSTATGRVLLAWQPPAVVDRILSRELEARTPLTVVDPGRLASVLQRVRDDGYSSIRQENELYLASVAVPLFDHTAGVAAALAVAGPDARMRPSRVREVLPVLRSTAAAISRELGARDGTQVAG